jgi:formylglycine-generating enzyme required for sulfatase activity
VTAGQYTAFLNAVGGVDTYALYYVPDMANTTYGCGIARTGSGTVSIPYTYTVAASFVNRPVNFVDYWCACRFANWLHNGQPTGAQGPGTTETGAYTLTSTAISRNTVVRNTDWKWAVTSEDEWYKAAYHKNNGNTGDYFDYPTRSNTPPGRDLADPLPGNNANINGSPSPISAGKHTTVVGEFQNSASPYGTFDQGGNVEEWNETITGSYRAVRGGAFDRESNRLLASGRAPYAYPLQEWSDVGFRVVSAVPEPGSLAMLAGIALTALLYWWRKHV